MLHIEGLQKSFGDRLILDIDTWQLSPGDRVGLIGPNGAGKTTLMRILAGQSEGDKGRFSWAPHTTVGYMAQELPSHIERTLDAEVWTAFTELLELQAQIAELEDKLHHATDDAALEALITEHSTAQHRYEDLEGYAAASKIGRVLAGLGFSEGDRQRPLREFSGGWQMRASLAKLLLSQPNLLLLDEPTNHLDLAALEWLESYLLNYPGAIVLVSHDRRFLDNVCDHIAEMDAGRLTDYPGNYTHYRETKESQIDSQLAAYDRQQKELTRQQAYIERFRASATRSTQAKSREKQLEKIERIEKPTADKSIHFQFPAPPLSGEIVLQLKKLGKSWGDNLLFKSDDINAERGQRIAVLGPNGVGKTTLFRMLTGQERQTEGRIIHGHNVRIGYYSQHQAESLSQDKIVLDEIYDEVPRMSQTEVRSLLARFLFIGETVFKPISVLSGGERARLALAKMLLRSYNLLLLDEPTNHLDIPSKDVLAEALSEFPGTILLISHDRAFIDAIATHVWEMGSQTITPYEGNYMTYLTRQQQVAKEPAKAKESVEAKAMPEAPKGDHRQLRKRLAAVEKRIVQLEEQRGVDEAELARPEIFSNATEVERLSNRIATSQTELNTLNEEWEAIALQLE